MYQISYGLFVLTAREGEKDNGCIINTAMQVTTNPNRITITVNKSNLTHDMIMRTGVFNVSVISERADFSLYQRFGFQSGRDADKFSGFEDFTIRTENGLRCVLYGANAYLCCKVVSATDLGTHTLFVADVTDGDVVSRDPSATYAYYQSSVKPRVEAPAKGAVRWVCKVCGYVYEGDPLPVDFVCPICKHGAQDFERQGG